MANIEVLPFNVQGLAAWTFQRTVNKCQRFSLYVTTSPRPSFTYWKQPSAVVSHGNESYNTNSSALAWWLSSEITHIRVCGAYTNCSYYSRAGHRGASLVKCASKWMLMFNSGMKCYCSTYNHSGSYMLLNSTALWNRPLSNHWAGTLRPLLECVSHHLQLKYHTCITQ